MQTISSSVRFLDTQVCVHKTNNRLRRYFLKKTLNIPTKNEELNVDLRDRENYINSYLDNGFVASADAFWKLLFSAHVAFA